MGGSAGATTLPPTGSRCRRPAKLPLFHSSERRSPLLEPSAPYLRVVARGQLRLSEIDRTMLLARLMRVQTDLLILAGDTSIPADERDKLRLAATITGEVNLPAASTRLG